jgi:hypothetical protein
MATVLAPAVLTAERHDVTDCAVGFPWGVSNQDSRAALAGGTDTKKQG